MSGFLPSLQGMKGRGNPSQIKSIDSNERKTLMKILVGLSGGVDSAVSAYLLKKQGHEVTGAMMSIWDDSLPVPKIAGGNGCIAPKDGDIKTVKKIAEFLDIPFTVIDCSSEYKKTVLENFKSEYKSGRTPNPCVWCNAYIKFGVLPEAAKRGGIRFDKFATGHYANIVYNDEIKKYQLKKAKDLNKDQTYFLYRLSQKTLSETLFPLGNLIKSEVRSIAKEIGLPVAEKPDSQDFYCGDYNDILGFQANPGDIVDKNGKVLGKHSGIWNYTIGKRKGLGLPGGTKEPLYVIDISAKQNVIVLGSKEDLYSKSLTAEKVSWGSVPVPKEPFNATVKIRRQNAPSKAAVIPMGESTAEVVFETPQMSVTSGQSAVFYKDDVVFGGGIIKRRAG